MIWAFKITVLFLLLAIAVQDLKERKVYWFLFPLVGLNLAGLYFLKTPIIEILWLNILLNSLLVSFILLILFLTTKLFFKKKFLNHSFGLGDALLFYALAIGFPTVSFIILFAASILFSFLVFFLLKKYQKIETVPLAGLMSIFLFLILLTSFFIKQPSIYTF